ncbi:MAG: hypothetical protein ACPGWM_08200 [Flavobacteriales bacterium]
MKTKLFLIIFSILMTSAAFAQDEKIVDSLGERPEMTFSENDIQVKKESVNAYTAYIKGESGQLEKEWKKFMKDNYSVDFKKSKGMLSAEEAKIAIITQDVVYLYTVIAEDEKGARMDVMLRMGGKYLTDKDFPVESGKLRSILNTFLHDFYVEQYDNVLSAQRKEQDKLNKEVDKMVREGEKLMKSESSKESDIKKAEENIVKTEQLIVDSNAKIEQLKVDIENYKKDIEQLKKDQVNNAKKVEEGKKVAAEKAKKIEKLKQNADAIR